MVKEPGLTEDLRAEDILLGSLGFGESARIVSLKVDGVTFSGVGEYTDGERFDFENSDELDELQEWALTVLTKKFPQ